MLGHEERSRSELGAVGKGGPAHVVGLIRDLHNVGWHRKILTESVPPATAGSVTVVNQGFGSFRHLAGRFFGAVDPRAPEAELDTWARSFLIPAERSLWNLMSGPDRRHAISVARQVEVSLYANRQEPDRPVMAAALLHDVGKVRSDLGTFSRVAVTLAAIAKGREALAAIPPQAPRWRARVGEYLTHDVIGAEMLAGAGSDRLTVTWAGEHHLPPERWSTPPQIAAALSEADGD